MAYERLIPWHSLANTLDQESTAPIDSKKQLNEELTSTLTAYLLFCVILFDHAHQLWYNKTVELLMFICIKYQLHPSFLSWDVAENLKTCYFGYFEYDWPCPPILMASTCRKVYCLSGSKKSTSSFHSFLRYYKDIANLLLYTLCGYAWQHMAAKNDGISL